ncbi:hypothetical protein QBC44DRAFT_42220 [Cladorrhinum sp. PSN332]|nr:hypothetical protein QBC44DRAFT_42220 [Cladorrhinum sp. PSN332]
MAPSTSTMRSERPYNTRRKSLSLHSLGIHVPVTHAARAAAAANRERALSSPVTMAASSSSSEPPSKKLKRAHSQDSDDAPTSEPLPKKREDSTVRFENTPPPSPPARHQSVEMDDDEMAQGPKTIDMKSINDEIVEAVIIQLQSTGNRPHLVKELAAVLMQQLKIVQQSANPCAIISSRLATYLKRNTWSEKSPCPLAKELESVHPRRTYFYLTTCPHQPLPDPSQVAASLAQLAAQSREIISPAVSTAASNSEDAEDESRRRELSPSPEVDLSSHEFDEMDDDMPGTPVGSYGSYGPYSLHGYFPRNSVPRDGRSSSRRAASPALEKEEKEFTQTADGCRRKLNGDSLKAQATDQQQGSLYLDKDEGASLFPFASSPAIRPSSTFFPIVPRKEFETSDAWTSSKFEGMLEWDRSPENIELEELDGLLNDY